MLIPLNPMVGFPLQRNGLLSNHDHTYIEGGKIHIYFTTYKATHIKGII